MNRYILSSLFSLTAWELSAPDMALAGLRAIYAALHSPSVNYKQLYLTGILKEDKDLEIAFSELASLIRVVPRRVENTLKRLRVDVGTGYLSFEDNRVDTAIFSEILMFLLHTQPCYSKITFIIKRNGSYVKHIVTKDGVLYEFYNSVAHIAENA